MSIPHRIKLDLFREPTGGRSPWLATVFGLLMVGLALGSYVVSASWLEPKFAFLGLAFFAMGTAEALSAKRLRLVGILRISAICLFFTFAGITIIPTLLNSEGTNQLMMLFYFAVSVLFAVSLYVAWAIWNAGRTQ